MINLLFFLIGAITATIGFLVWTWLILREERRIADRKACTPDWCPMTIDTEELTAEDIERMPHCSTPHKHN